MAESENKRTRTKTKNEDTIQVAVEAVGEVTPPTQGHILQILDEKGLPLIFIGDNFKDLPLESKIAVITHLNGFIETQKGEIVKMVEDL